MSHVIQSVEELMEKSPEVDNQAVFEQLWAITGEIRAKIEGRFKLERDPAMLDLEKYSAIAGGGEGHLHALTGEEIDWMIHSYFGNPSQGFTNMHLTTWLGPQTNVPHWGMALGTIPDMFIYLDYIPRVDLTQDVHYLDKYYEEQNDVFMGFEGDAEFQPFVSRTIYMRLAQSPTSLCYVAKPSQENIKKIRETAHLMMDRWLAWVDLAKKKPVAEQVELADGDLKLRKTISQRDPANVMGEKLLGTELTKRLVGTLWGEGRQSRRAGSWQQ